MGAWTIPRKKIDENVLKKINKGHKNIYFVGDYLNNIDDTGNISSAVNSCLKLIKIL
jgi:hypothetical protein